MEHKIPLILLFSLFFSFSSFPVLINYQFFHFDPISATVLSRTKYEDSFHVTGRLEKSIRHLNVKNEAKVQIYSLLYPNSTNKITLRFEPIEEWNMTHIDIGIGQEVNVTITNGVVLPPDPSDAPAYLQVFVQLEYETDEVWGNFCIWILDYGWDNRIPWPFIPVFIALFMIYIKRSIMEKKSPK